jgi:hypothetical protein
VSALRNMVCCSVFRFGRKKNGKRVVNEMVNCGKSIMFSGWVIERVILWVFVRAKKNQAQGSCQKKSWLLESHNFGHRRAHVSLGVSC